MKILVLMDFFPPRFNAGGERISYLISKGYLDAGHSVTVVTTTPDAPAGSVEEIHYQGLRVLQVGAHYPERWQSYLSLYYPPALKALRDLLTRESFDCAHVHNIHKYLSYAALPLLKRRGIPFVLTTHDAMSVDYGKFQQGIDPQDLALPPQVQKKISALKIFRQYRWRYNPLRNPLVRYALNRYPKKIATVSHQQEELLNANGIANTTTVHNGIPPLGASLSEASVEAFRVQHHLNGRFVLLVAGRLSAAKGMKQISQVMERLIRARVPATLLLATQKDAATQRFMDQICQYGDPAAVACTGWLKPEQMELAYRVSDVALVPSICYDMFPTVALEAMAHEVPVIAGCFGGAQEAVEEGKTGFIINPFNTAAFEEKLTFLFRHPEAKAQMGRAGRQRVREQFGIDRTVQKYLELLTL